jgi:hypothetical protein
MFESCTHACMARACARTHTLTHPHGPPPLLLLYSLQMSAVRREVNRPPEVSLAEFSKLQSSLGRAADDARAATQGVHAVQVRDSLQCFRLRSTGEPRLLFRADSYGMPAGARIDLQLPGVGSRPQQAGSSDLNLCSHRGLRACCGNNAGRQESEAELQRTLAELQLRVARALGVRECDKVCLGRWGGGSSRATAELWWGLHRAKWISRRGGDDRPAGGGCPPQGRACRGLTQL